MSWLARVLLAWLLRAHPLPHPEVLRMDSEGMSMPPRCMRPGAWHSAPCDFPGPQGKFQGKFPLRLYSRFYYYPQGRDLEPRESLRLHQELSRWQMHCHLSPSACHWQGQWQPYSSPRLPIQCRRRLCQRQRFCLLPACQCPCLPASVAVVYHSLGGAHCSCQWLRL